MLHHLLHGRLNNAETQYNLYLSQRGNNSINHFEEAVSKALAADGKTVAGTIQYKLEIVPGKEMPELSIIDYLIWAVQRKLLQGESRYFDALNSRYATVLNLYETK